MPTLPAAQQIKLVAFDLDGTLFNRHAEISDRTASTLAQVAGQGVQLVIASGRSQSSIIPRVGNVPFIQWAICSNGATLYDLNDQRVAGINPIDDDHANDLVDQVIATIPDALWAWESPAGHQWTQSFAAFASHGLMSRNIVDDKTSLAAQPLKIFIGHREVDHYDLLDLLRPVVPHDLSISTSGANFVEVTAPGVNKATALSDLCRQLEVAATEAAAFGDNLNDIEMLTWVGHGYAMANAHPDLKAVAAKQTPHNHDDDGVAMALEALFGLR